MQDTLRALSNCATFPREVIKRRLVIASDKQIGKHCCIQIGLHRAYRIQVIAVNELS